MPQQADSHEDPRNDVAAKGPWNTPSTHLLVKHGIAHLIPPAIWLCTSISFLFAGDKVVLLLRGVVEKWWTDESKGSWFAQP